jgi:hypothetical protein
LGELGIEKPCLVRVPWPHGHLAWGRCRPSGKSWGRHRSPSPGVCVIKAPWDISRRRGVLNQIREEIQCTQQA